MSNTTGLSGTAIGTFALQNNTTGSANTAVGRTALAYNTTGYNNTAVGEASMNVNTTGYYNTATGRAALSMNTSGNYNTALGYEAMNNNQTGVFNLALGAFSDVSASNLENATAIGANAYVSQSNSMVLGSVAGVNNSTSSTKVGIGTAAPTANLDVVDSVATDTRFHLQNKGSGNSGVEIRSTSNNTQQYIDFTNNATSSSSPDYQNRIISSASRISVITSDAGGIHMGIGTGSPHASAALEVASTTKGVLYPRMTTTQRDAIAFPAEGLMLFNISTRCLEMYGNNNWQSVFCACTNGTIPPSSMTGTFTGVCASATYTYTANAVPGALSYTWNITGAPNSIATSSGNSLQIIFGSGTNNPAISISATTSCGTSPYYNRTISIGAPALAATTVQTPTAGTGTSVVINWSAVSGATGYYLDVATDAGFTSFTSGGLNNQNVGNVTTYNVTGLTNCATYYIRVRPYNTCVTGGNSNTIVHLVRTYNSTTFDYTGNLQSFTVPSCITRIYVKAWGAGGGSSSNINDAQNIMGAGGGSGGFVDGYINVTPGSNYYVVVGGGGASSGANNAYGGGGSGSFYGGCGGGYSGVFSALPSQANAIVIAGGGGGGGKAENYGLTGFGLGHGGGAGNNGLLNGAQSGNNGGGGVNGGANGSALQGGNGSTANNGGGGGGGYVGGGGSGNVSGPGGGSNYISGSGFVVTTQSNGNNHGGAWSTFGAINPPATNDPYYSSGIAVGNYHGVGGNGKIVIYW